MQEVLMIFIEFAILFIGIVIIASLVVNKLWKNIEK